LGNEGTQETVVHMAKGAGHSIWGNN